MQIEQLEELVGRHPKSSPLFSRGPVFHILGPRVEGQVQEGWWFREGDGYRDTDRGEWCSVQSFSNRCLKGTPGACGAGGSNGSQATKGYVCVFDFWLFLF